MMDAVDGAHGRLPILGSREQKTALEDQPDLEVVAAQRIARLADAAQERRGGVKTTLGEAAEENKQARQTLGLMQGEDLEERND